MLQFQVLENGQVPAEYPLLNAYLIGADGNAVRGQVQYADGLIQCQTREAGVISLSLLFPVGNCGQMMVQTCLLPQGDEPYLLSLELARHQLMMLYNKLEDWGLFHLEPDHSVIKRLTIAKRFFIDALCAMPADLPRAQSKAHDSLVLAIDGCEELAVDYSQKLLEKRKSADDRSKLPIGCGVDVSCDDDRLRAAILTNFDFIYLPISWRMLAPEEGEYSWALLDKWVKWAAQAHLPVIAGPLVSFEPTMLPDWLYIWEHDFDTVRDLIYEHVERVVNRYGSVISRWNVVSGLHVNNHFSLGFDQIMDLTRMTTMLVKKLQDKARVLVEICQPFGEYYGSNARSIPPLMYGDLLTRGGLSFEGFCVKLLMGQAVPGQYTRDLMQLSHLLDQYAALDKPFTLSVAAPSEPVTLEMMTQPQMDEQIDPNSGFWRKPWSPLVQSHWLEAVFQIALSKPHIDGVAWHDLVDHSDIELPRSGLVDQQMLPKSALRRLTAFRQNLVGQVKV